MSGQQLTDEQRLAWLQLLRCENVGPRTFLSLVNQFGGAGAALAQLPDLARRGGGRITVFPRAEAEREIEALAMLGGRFIGRGEPDFPAALAAADGAPPLIAVIGRTDLTRTGVGIVGARNASAAGRTFAERLAAAAGAEGYLVVSGLARGIDAAAHAGSLRSGTAAVLAGGLDRIYPPEHGTLARRIVEEGGCLVSEMPLGWSARARDFPRRNRIVAGLSIAVVVVEAAVRSGSLITARMAADLGREVCAVPGSPLDPRAEGTNELLRDGATLIGKSKHLIEALSGLPSALPPDPAGVRLERAAGGRLCGAGVGTRADRGTALAGADPAGRDRSPLGSGGPHRPRRATGAGTRRAHRAAPRRTGEPAAAPVGLATRPGSDNVGATSPWGVSRGSRG